MDKPNRIDLLFRKFIDNAITKKEYGTLMDFIKDPGSDDKLKEVMDAHWKRIDASGKKMDKVGDGGLIKLVLNKVESIEVEKMVKVKSKRRILSNTVYGIAATMAMVIGLFYGYQQGIFFKRPTPLSDALNPNAIMLKLDNGRVEVVSEDQERKISNADGIVVGFQKANQINYNTEQLKLKELIYNELTVPYGKRFDIVLSDGTEVKVNAGTVIKYPVQFITGKKREVFIKGEAYFDVTEDRAHPFVVNANDMSVEVLGTKFNVSSYMEDQAVNTVLVEGSVKLYNVYEEQMPETHTMLTPGHMAAWDKNLKKIAIKPVDVEIYTAWKDGVLLFKKSSFENIEKKLERYYDIAIENNYGFLESQVYTATFNNESIEVVIEAFKEDTPFEYVMKNNKLIITEPLTK